MKSHQIIHPRDGAACSPNRRPVRLLLTTLLAVLVLVPFSATATGAAAVAAQPPTEATSAQTPAERPRELQVGESRSGRALIAAGPTASRRCISVYYNLRQVAPKEVRFRFRISDLCRSHATMVFKVRADRFGNRFAPGKVKHRGWRCYGWEKGSYCNKLGGTVSMYDPKGIQKFQALTTQFSVLDANWIHKVNPIGEKFYA